ncbi:MAG: DUF1624 domain-containing protein [Proteobacteria bacterium]|nr:DUF1624 domain-containing protein [Pseudomonadota bacterium]MBS0572162.1 DUF1624 domain-containing protein [Pseudomonadota bacterium]
MAADALPKRRLVWLDLARTAALAAMASYHFGYDLEAFGHLPPGTMTTGPGALYARAIASTFLVLVGIGLWLAHGQGIRWRPFMRRLAMIGAGAALVSTATWFVFGPLFVFYGILHSIAVSSLVGLLFLRLPAPVTALAAVAAFLAPLYLQTGAFDSPWLIWTGLSTLPVYAVDFLPPFPWLAPVLAGIALARASAGARLWQAAAHPGRGPRLLSWPGRHSLFVYLVHQPLLIGTMLGARKLGIF